MSTLDAQDKIGVISKRMINCREKNYTPGEFANKDAYSLRSYASGGAY
jgi:hypothetical protein